MRTKNFVCQLVEAQMARYLAGHALSDEALGQLDAHIAECPDCKAHLEAKKAELLGIPDAPPTRIPDPRERILHAIVDAGAAAKPAPAKPAKAAPKPATKLTVQWTPLLLSIGLAAVLVAMSFLVQNPTAILGPKASSALPATTPAAAPATDIADEPTTPAPEPGSPDFIGAEPPVEGALVFDTLADYEASLEPQGPPNSEPEPPVVEVRSQPVRRQPRRTRANPPPATTTRPTIRVYDAQGKPLNR